MAEIWKMTMVISGSPEWKAVLRAIRKYRKHIPVSHEDVPRLNEIEGRIIQAINLAEQREQAMVDSDGLAPF